MWIFINVVKLQKYVWGNLEQWLVSAIGGDEFREDVSIVFVMFCFLSCVLGILMFMKIFFVVFLMFEIFQYIIILKGGSGVSVLFFIRNVIGMEWRGEGVRSYMILGKVFVFLSFGQSGLSLAGGLVSYIVVRSSV